MWEIEHAIQISKVHLRGTPDLIAKIVLAKQYGYREWLEEAYFAISHREESLSIEEMRRLSLELISEITQVREVHLKASAFLKQTCGGSFVPRHCSWCSSSELEAPSDGSRLFTCKSCGSKLFVGPQGLFDNHIKNLVQNAIANMTRAQTGADNFPVL